MLYGATQKPKNPENSPSTPHNNDYRWNGTRSIVPSKFYSTVPQAYLKNPIRKCQLSLNQIWNVTSWDNVVCSDFNVKKILSNTCNLTCSKIKSEWGFQNNFHVQKHNMPDNSRTCLPNKAKSTLVPRLTGD